MVGIEASIGAGIGDGLGLFCALEPGRPIIIFRHKEHELRAFLPKDGLDHFAAQPSKLHRGVILAGFNTRPFARHNSQCATGICKLRHGSGVYVL
jgi:hypothetical protein